MNIYNEILARLRAHKYEVSEEGLYFPDNRLLAGGVFDFSVNGGPLVLAPNRVVEQGLTYAIGAALSSGVSKISDFFLAPFAGNVTPAATWTAANFTGNSTEFTNYTEAARQAWVEAGVDSFIVSNLASRAVFTIGGGAQTTIWGAGLLSVATKSSTAGTLVAAAKLTVARDNLQENDEVSIGYSIQIADAS